MSITSSSSSPLPRVLILDDTPAFHHQLRYGLRQHFEFESAFTLDAFWALLEHDRNFGLILLDLVLTPDSVDKTQGLGVLMQLRHKLPSIPVIVVTNQPDYESAMMAVLQFGAKDYLPKNSYEEVLWSSKFKRHIPSLPQIFISYAHEDRKYKEQFLARLKVLQKHRFHLEIKEDGQIRHGYPWAAEIDGLMAYANVFIFLVSDHLLASDFITDVEMPAALHAYSQRGALILPILLTPSQWQLSKLSTFQKLPDRKEYLRNSDEAWFDMIQGLIQMFEREFPTSVFRP